MVAKRKELTLADALQITSCESLSELVAEVIEARRLLAEQEFKLRLHCEGVALSDRVINGLLRKLSEVDPDHIIAALEKSTVRLDDDD
jgi:hypothetical protein